MKEGGNHIRSVEELASELPQMNMDDELYELMRNLFFAYIMLDKVEKSGATYSFRNPAGSICCRIPAVYIEAASQRALQGQQKRG